MESKQRVRIARVGEVQPGQTKKFTLRLDGRETECFVVNHRDRLFAYVNQCRHVPMAMDWVENQFLTDDGRYIQCATHGAVFEPDTGECVFGPPCGQFLFRVPLSVEGDHVTASQPTCEEGDD